jgi:hypothetical protein
VTHQAGLLPVLIHALQEPEFSTSNYSTGSSAWVAALVMMALADVLTRLIIIYLRGRRLAAERAGSVGRITAGIRG